MPQCTEGSKRSSKSTSGLKVRSARAVWLAAALLAPAAASAQRPARAPRAPRAAVGPEIARALAEAEAALAAMAPIEELMARSAAPLAFPAGEAPIAQAAEAVALAEPAFAPMAAMSEQAMAMAEPALALARQAVAAVPAMDLVPFAPLAPGVPFTPYAPFAAAGLAPLAPVLDRIVVPEPWLQADPADSLYRAARDALNRREFERAADLFASIRARFPRSGYVPDSFYFQAFALQRLGGRVAEQRAIALLDEQRKGHPNANTRADAEQLRTRLLGTRAQAGDAQAAAAVETAAQTGCDQSNQELRATALSALISMDSQRALPILKEILQDRDECSAVLRRQAVFMIARATGDQAVDVMLDLAQRNPDPDPEVRQQAVFWLSKVKTPEAAAALESILAQSTDPRMQEAAVFALTQQGDPRAVQTLKSYAERSDAPRQARLQAIFWLGRDAKNAGPGYLRDLYGKLDDAEMKEQVISSLGQLGGADNRSWLIERVKDVNEPANLRQAALFWAGKDGGLSVADLRGLYDQLPDRGVREQVIFVLSRSAEPAAVDALMEIASEATTERALREQAVHWLSQSKDPRAAEFLLKLIRGK